MKFILIGIIVLGIPLGLLVFAKSQHQQSRLAYEKSLEQLKAAGEPTSMSEFIDGYLKHRDQLDFARQDRLWAAIKHAENWAELPSFVSNKLKKPIALSADQQAWLENPTHVKDNAELASLLNEGYLNKTMLAWLVQDHENPDSLSAEEMFSLRIPSLMGSRWHSIFMALQLTQNRMLETALQWRALHVDNSYLIGAMINTAVLEELDFALAYHAWQFPSNNNFQIQIDSPKSLLKSAIIGEELLFGPLYAKLIAESFWFDADIFFDSSSPNIIQRCQTYMWGLRNCAAANQYHLDFCASLGDTSTLALKDIPIPQNTWITFTANYLESLQMLYASNAHQRLCQISMNLSAYYHQHQSIPADSAALRQALPETYQLLSGDLFSFHINYQTKSPSIYLLEVDSVKLPDSADGSRIRKMSASTSTIFAFDDYYLFAEMNR